MNEPNKSNQFNPFRPPLRPVKPQRSVIGQQSHDRHVELLANALKNHGFDVKADHIKWLGKRPDINLPYIPDVIAESKQYGNAIFEVEDLVSYKSEHTKMQLTTFSHVKGYTTYLIVPEFFNRNSLICVKNKLKEWGLYNVRIGTSNLNTKVINFL